MVTSIVWAVQWLTGNLNRFLPWTIPYLDAVRYLLEVASQEHSFDCSQFRSLMENYHSQEEDDDVPRFDEESILECFVRRRLFEGGQEKEVIDY